MSVSTLMQPPAGRNVAGAATNPADGQVVGRLAYPQLFEPKRFGEQRNVPGSGSGEPKYGCSIIAPGKFVNPMRDSVQSAMRSVIDEVYPDARKLPSRGLRGTAKKDPLVKLVADYPRMWADAPEGAIFVRMNSLDMPVFVDAHVQTLGVEQAKLLFVAGCWVCAAFRAFHYTTGGDPGIGLALNSLQFIKPGPRLGVGRAAPGDIFAPIDDDDPLFADLDVWLMAKRMAAAMRYA
jgi:hypothetical protein